MNYSELIQAYFERSVALQWYWTIYVLVIGGIVDQEWFERREEKADGIANSRHLLPRGANCSP